MQNTNDIYIFLFIIEIDGKKKYFTSENISRKFQDNIFLPYSSLSVKEITYDDSGNDMLLINGIFHQGGITSNMPLENISIQLIKLYHVNEFYSELYFCVQYIKNNLDFELKCKNAKILLDQPLLKLVSKKCRAEFGDFQCKVDLKKFSREYTLQKIEDKRIYFQAIEESEKYFEGGFVIISNICNTSVSIHNITLHYKNYIEILENIDCTVINLNVLLIAGCDKSFETCCRKYSNAINFRGEPFIDKTNEYWKQNEE